MCNHSEAPPSPGDFSLPSGLKAVIFFSYPPQDRSTARMQIKALAYSIMTESTIDCGSPGGALSLLRPHHFRPKIGSHYLIEAPWTVFLVGC